MQEGITHYLRKYRGIVFLIVLGCILIPSVFLRVSNALEFPIMKGYDANWHFIYIISVAQYAKFPLPETSFEFYQPPLYYFFAGAIFNIMSKIGANAVAVGLKMLSAVMSFILALISVVACYKYFTKNRPELVFICALAMYMPVNIYAASMIGNELLSGLFISIGLIYLINITLNHSYTFKSALVLGALTGFAVLSKYTGFILVITVFLICAVVYLKRMCNFKKIAGFILVFSTIILVISGWWYAKNLIVYGDPFIKSNDLKIFSGIYNSQPPGSRNLKDFIIFNPKIFVQPFLAEDGDFNKFYSTKYSNYNNAYNSVPAGTYATLWLENHGLFTGFKKNDFFMSKVLLFLGLVPFAGIIIGFFLSARKCLNNVLYLPVVIPVIISVIIYCAYNLKYPYFCHTKALFMIHLYIPALIFTCEFLKFCRRTIPAICVLYGIDLILLCLVIIKIYNYE